MPESDTTIDRPLADILGRANATELLAVASEGGHGELADVAQDIITTHSASTDTIATACYTLACMGYDCPEIATLLPPVVNYAQRHSQPVENTADNVARTLHALNVTPEQAEALLLHIDDAVEEAPLTSSDVFETIQYVGPVVANLGVGIEYLVGRIIALSNQGHTGRKAGILLREDIVESHGV